MVCLRSRSRLTVGLVALVCGLAACGSTHIAAAAVSARQPPKALPSQSALVIPPQALDSYGPSDLQAAEMEAAHDLLVKRCMARFGYAVEQRSYQERVSELTRIQQETASRLWGITDLAVAKVDGYGLPSWFAGGKPLTVSTAEGHAWYGFPSHYTGSTTVNGLTVQVGGCNGEAIREMARAGLSLSPTSAQRLAGSLARDAWAEAMGSAAVQRANRRWSSCMASHGYRYTTPLDAGIAPASLQVNIETAVTDIGCKSSTGYLTAAYAAMNSVEREMIDQHFQVLDLARQQTQTQGRELVKFVAAYGLA